MKYILFKENNNLTEEMKSRKEYIFSTFPGVYRIEEKDYDDRIVLECYSIYKLDIIVIVGHYFSIDKYIMDNSNDIVCDTLIIISCYVYRMPLNKLKKVKKIYCSKSVDGETERHIGKDYGFEFKITDSELIFYNTKKFELNEKIRRSFDCIEKNKKKGRK